MLACERAQFLLPMGKATGLEKLFPWDAITLEYNKNYFGPRVIEAQVWTPFRVLLKKNIGTTQLLAYS